MKMRTIVPHANARLTFLKDLLLKNVTFGLPAFDIAGPKADGTVTVRFRSTVTTAAVYYVSVFQALLNEMMIVHVRTDMNKFTFALDQIRGETHNKRVKLEP